MHLKQWVIAFTVVLLSACSSDHHPKLLGYVEGRYVYLSSPVSGQLVQLSVQKGETVKANQLAFALDPDPELSQLKDMEANLAYTQKMLVRNEELRKTNVISQSTLDLSRQQYQSALQQVSRYKWMVSEKTIRIPEDGFVQDTLFRQNEYVPAGKPVIQFLPPENRILIFFVPEKNLSEIKMGQTISFTCDNCVKKITATIDYISSQAEYTPPVIYSKDSREKLVYWVEAKIDPAMVKSMHPGEPVEVSI